MGTSSNPKCSHCGHELDDEQTWHGEYTVGKVSTGDCDESELKCPNLDCGKMFHVRCWHEVKFIQIDEDGDEI